MTRTTTDLEAATRTFYSELDANDPEVFSRRLTPDAVFAFNDVEPVSGTDGIAGFVGAWKGNFNSVTHGLDNIVVDDAKSTAGVEITVAYVFPDSTAVDVKGCSFLEFDGDRIRGWRVYVDTSRLT